MSRAKFTPLSLSQYFDGPDGFAGTFGWLCAYSADADFMDVAAERFTGQTRGTRAASGRQSLGLMLDVGNPQISPVAVPGVMHIAALADTAPYRLLHAKVALLGYRHKLDAGRWLLRLLVSTGNWTAGTLRDSLDLAWCIDVDSATLATADKEVRRSCADIAAAWDMLSWLRTQHDDTLLRAGTRSETSLAADSLEQWIGIASARQRGRARFVDNRNMSLLDATISKLRSEKVDVARNYLALGSGFFEGCGTGQKEPVVLRKIVQILQKRGWLTQSPVADVFVEEQACQAVAASAATMVSQGWTIRQAGQPSEPARRLHAKFVFSANYRSNSNKCGNPWLYMGSGNLTAPGFTSKMSQAGGNLEAGVVLVPEELYWKAGTGIDPTLVVGNLLPIQDDQCIDSFDNIDPGAEMEQRESQFAALPVSYLYWSGGDGGGWLRAELPQQFDGVRLLDGIGGELRVEHDNGAWWSGAMPRQVRICWANGAHSALVPVIDGFGRIAGARLADLDLEAASWELARFPGTAAEDEADDGEGDGDGDGAPTPKGRGRQSVTSGSVGQYAVRKMMALVEQIAEKQCGLHAADWQAWCCRLEQVLVQARNNAALEEFVKLSLNPFSPLYLPPFRPVFAERGDTPAGAMYEAVMGRVEQAWGVAGFDVIGDKT